MNPRPVTHGCGKPAPDLKCFEESGEHQPNPPSGVEYCGLRPPFPHLPGFILLHKDCARAAGLLW
jgi:hypothetical protein